MTTIQWLLIGGPAHGKLLHIKGGSQVRYPGPSGENYLYVGQNFLHNGKLYRIGVCYSEGGDRISDDIRATLIEQQRVAPLPDRVV